MNQPQSLEDRIDGILGTYYVDPFNVEDANAKIADEGLVLKREELADLVRSELEGLGTEIKNITVSNEVPTNGSFNLRYLAARQIDEAVARRIG